MFFFALPQERKGITKLVSGQGLGSAELQPWWLIELYESGEPFANLASLKSLASASLPPACYPCEGQVDNAGRKKWQPSVKAFKFHFLFAGRLVNRRIVAELLSF